MKKEALKVEFQRKEAEKARRDEILKAMEIAKNPTSLRGRVGVFVDGDIEMGVRQH
jgi:hypothetical protein